MSREYDLVVLAVGQCASPQTAELGRVLGIETNRWGFLADGGFRQTRTARNGIYVCGSAIAPADIPETVSQACAAACEATTLLSPVRAPAGKATASPVANDVRTAVFICRCGDEIPSVVDVGETSAFARSLPGVVTVEDVPYLCHKEGLDQVRLTIEESGAGRMVFAACSAYRHRFEKASRDAGIDLSMCETVGLRERVARVHSDRARATEKAQRMVAMAVERMRGQELSTASPSAVNGRCLVVGGGTSGMVAALSLAGQGFEVALVEKSAALGGHTRDILHRADGKDTQAFLRDTVEEVKCNPRIRLYMTSEVVRTSGYTGSFRSEIRTTSPPIPLSASGEGDCGGEVDHGAVIIATGAQDYQPAEYLYGQDSRIVTQRDMHRLLSEGAQLPSTIVMIQCVGSRDSQRHYCSRTCCDEAIAASLRIKQRSPQTQVFILHRDIMTCGFAEQYYTRAREAGVLFVRYDPDRKPEVSTEDDALLVTVDDPVLGEKLEITGGMLVLSTGIVPEEGNRRLADMFGIELDEDGFFKEASKFRPVDSGKDGVFICGRANAPVSLEQAVVQAQAAALRAAAILGRERLNSTGLISEVNERTCRGCALCVTACAYSAREIDDDRKVAVVRETLCRGCGACAAVCPNGAARLRGLKETQVFDMLAAALAGKPERRGDGGI